LEFGLRPARISPTSEAMAVDHQAPARANSNSSVARTGCAAPASATRSRAEGASQRKNVEATGKSWRAWNSMEFRACSMRARASGGPFEGPDMVRDLGAKLRITAAVLGCASQKDLCARFRGVNPGTWDDACAKSRLTLCRQLRAHC